MRVPLADITRKARRAVALTGQISSVGNNNDDDDDDDDDDDSVASLLPPAPTLFATGETLTRRVRAAASAANASNEKSD